MFAQVLQNSVYTFALVLTVFLVALAAGAWTARALMRRVADPVAGLAGLLLASGIGVAASPWGFAWWTGGLDYLGGERAWSGYVLDATLSTALVLLPPGLLVGSVFPFLLRSAQELGWSAGRAVGETAAQNTLGAVAGSLAAGFLLLDGLGLWPSLRLIAVGYVAAALWVAARNARPRPLLAGACALSLLALATSFDPAELPRVRIDARSRGERIVEIIEGSGGTVAVIDRGGYLRMKLDNHYGLGGTDDVEQEKRQALLPLALHPAPRSAFFLGLGSGITAGAALRTSLERVVVTEISPEVVRAARLHFGPWLDGLFEDPRAVVLAEDGRNFLQGSREHFDVIVSDLFMPWLAGAGSLYSVEAYQAGRERLAPGGLYAQWIALFQLSSEEFATIARTMAAVFPQLTLWRGNFRDTRPIALLVGSVDAPPLDPDAVRARLADGAGPDAARAGPQFTDPAQVLLLYQGNLASAPDALGAGPIERDLRPRIEYRAAIAHREKRAGRASALVGAEMVHLFERIFERVPPDSDPYLVDVSPERRGLPRAGLDLLRAAVLERSGDREGASAARAAFAAAWSRAGLDRARPEPRTKSSDPGDGNETSARGKSRSDQASDPLLR
jgi:spermidine synthase